MTGWTELWLGDPVAVAIMGQYYLPGAVLLLSVAAPCLSVAFYLIVRKVRHRVLTAAGLGLLSTAVLSLLIPVERHYARREAAEIRKIVHSSDARLSIDRYGAYYLEADFRADTVAALGKVLVKPAVPRLRVNLSQLDTAAVRAALEREHLALSFQR